MGSGVVDDRPPQLLYGGCVDRTVSTTAPLDEIDHKIIELVQGDGRASYQKLSEAIGLSRPAARARLHRLLDARIVQVRGVVHPTVFGLNAYASAAISVSGPAREVALLLADDDDIPFVSLTAGNCGLIAELRCSDQHGLGAALSRISEIPTVTSLQTSIYSTIAKDAYWPPKPISVTEIDDSDRLLLAALQRDGRASYVELGEQTGLSSSAARARVARLVDGGAIHIGARIRPDVRNTQHVVGFGLSVRGDPAKVLDDLQQHPNIQYLASAIGHYDVIGTAIARSTSEMVDLLDDIRSADLVRAAQTWAHLTFVKEDYDRSPVVSTA